MTDPLREPGIHVCGGIRDATEFRTRVLWCPRCKRRRRVMAWFCDWYGWYASCKRVYYGRNGHRYVCGQKWSSA